MLKTDALFANATLRSQKPDLPRHTLSVPEAESMLEDRFKDKVAVAKALQMLGPRNAITVSVSRPEPIPIYLSRQLLKSQRNGLI